MGRLVPASVTHSTTGNLVAQVEEAIAALADPDAVALSGGQRQRTAIARALAMESPILLLDEPTAELDAANRDLVIALLGEATWTGAILVVVSHEPELLAAGNDVLVLHPDSPTDECGGGR